MPLKALVFDFDLTLADASQGIYQCMNHALNQLGYQNSDYESVKKTIGHSLADCFHILTGNDNSVDSERFVKTYVAHADKIMADLTFIFPEVFKVMPIIKNRDLKCAIVSTKYRYRIEDVLKRDHLELYFELVVGGEDVKNFKPDPEGLLMAAEKIGVGKNEVLYIGDSLIDAQTAKNAGIDFCAVLTGTTTTGEFRNFGVNQIITDLNSLSEILSLY